MFYKLNEEEIHEKVFKMAFCIPGEHIDYFINKVKKEITSDLVHDFVMPIMVLSMLVTVFVLYMLSKLSSEVTEPIIGLYHKIRLILDAHNIEKKQLLNLNEANIGHSVFKSKNSINVKKKSQYYDIMAGYKPVSYEMNFLYKQFSNLVRTIKIARESLFEGDDNQALLNYHEVTELYEKYHNIQQLGRCFNNLACIYFKKFEYEKTFTFLYKAIDIQTRSIDESYTKGDVSEKDMRM